MTQRQRTNRKIKSGTLVSTITAVACACLLSAGCGTAGDDDVADAGGHSDDPLYAINSNTYTPEGSTGLIAFASSYDASVQLDYSKAIELGGGGRVFGVPRSSTFFVASWERPEITKFTLDKNDDPVEGARLSYSNYAEYVGAATFIADDKAYSMNDQAVDQIIIWNPADMTVAGTIALDAAIRPGWTARTPSQPALRDGELFLGIGWAHNEEDRIYKGSGLLVIDTATDEVVSFTEDERCGAIWSSPALGPEGHLYFACASYPSILHHFSPDNAPEPCLLRVKPGERRFDPDFYLSLGEATGSRIAGGLVRGPGDTLYVKAVDEALVDLDSLQTADDLFPVAAWRWYALDLEAREATAVTNLAPGAGSINTFAVDGADFSVVEAQDFSATQLIEMTTPGEPTPRVTVLGASPAMLRLR